MNQAGDRLAIGSTGQQYNGVVSGGVWVISDFGSTSQTQVLLGPSSASANMFFSYSLAMDATGDVLVVGAPRIGTGWPGRAFVFRFNGTTWVEELQLIGANEDLFGTSSCISAAGDVLAVGAPMRDVHPSWGDNAGAIEVYRRHQAGWAYEALLRPPDWNGNDAIGNYMAMSADGKVIAATSSNNNGSFNSGAVYIFEHTGAAWAQTAKIVEPVSYSGSGFGISPALDATGRVLAIGNCRDSRLLNMQGAVSLYRRSGSTWTVDAVLLPSSPVAGGNFGMAVSLNSAGDRALVGVPVHSNSAGVGVGAVEEFEFSSGVWRHAALHLAPSPEPNANFGRSISGVASRRRWVVSEPAADAYGLNLGQIHVFDAPCLGPRVYCSAQANSLGCLPQLATQGTPSNSAPAGFTISLTNTRSQQNGLLFYGTNGRAALPWNVGTLCVQPPLRRTPLINSGGSSPRVVDCSGLLTVDFNTWASTSNDPELFPGQHVRAQFYARDPSATSLVYLSEALEFYLEP